MVALGPDLGRHGFVYHNPYSKLASAPLIILKLDPARGRIYLDLRPVNPFTKRLQFPMPTLDHKLTNMAQSRYFVNFDFTQGYWQLLQPDSQGCQSFITSDGIYRPNQVPYGSTKAVRKVKSSLSYFPRGSQTEAPLWLYDCLLHEHASEFLTLFGRFIWYFTSWNQKPRSTKFMLYTT